MKEIKSIKSIGTPRKIELSIEPKTHVIVISQGDNEVKVTKDQVNSLRMLKEGTKYPDGVFTTKFPSNRFEKRDNDIIVASAVSEFNDSIVMLNSAQVDKIVRYMDKNRPYVTWERDLVRKGIVYW